MFIKKEEKNDKNLIDYGNCHFCEKQMTWYDINSSSGRISSDNKQICQACSDDFIKAYSKHSLNNQSEDDIIISNYTSRDIMYFLCDKVVCPNCNAKIDNIDSRYCDQCGYQFNPPELVIEMVCNKCGGKYLESKKFCPDDGTKLTKKEIIKKTDGDIDSTINKKKVISQKTSGLQEKFKKADYTNYIIASSGQRFANLILDSIFIYIFAIFLGGFLVIIEMDFILELYSDFWLGVLIYFTYYVNFETFFRGRTPAKYITRTKAVCEDGSKLTIGKAFGRTICRYIPFEVFSFFGNRPVGWHDKLPETIVISVRNK